jgi:hypothetical protein
MTRQVLAQVRYENGLYVLNPSHQAFVAVSPKKASFELWHKRLGHVSFDTILRLNKEGYLCVTSILPKPVLCSACQLSKGRRLSCDLNEQQAFYPLDLIHCDLWGPSPVTSNDGYRFDALFLDDHSRFTWFYP